MEKSKEYYISWLIENNYVRKLLAENGFGLDYKKERELNEIAGYLERSISRNSIGQSETKLLRYDALLGELYNLAKIEQSKTDNLLIDN